MKHIIVQTIGNDKVNNAVDVDFSISVLKKRFFNFNSNNTYKHGNDYASLKFQTVELLNNQDIPNLPAGKMEWLEYIAIFYTVEYTFM